MTIYSIWIMLGWHSDRFSFLFAFLALFWCFVSALRISHLVFFVSRGDAGVEREGAEGINLAVMGGSGIHAFVKNTLGGE